MATLSKMPPIIIPEDRLAEFGKQWSTNGECLSRKPPFSSNGLVALFDEAVGNSLATFLGGIPIVIPNANALTPPGKDCVEVGPVRIIGGVRPQNFDVGYRPDGVRFAFDSKSLNDRKSIGKNWQNMINDIATEATSVHTRFPHAIVAFMVIYPAPCVSDSLRRATTQTLERLAHRSEVNDPDHMAEAISFVLWNPLDGTIDPEMPSLESPLRIEKFSSRVEELYVERYKGLPPHSK